MNKSILYIFLCALLFAGCLKDDNNYDFAQPEVITVTGLESSITAVSGIDDIKIDPVATSNKAGDLEFMWGVYETNVQGYAPVLDTISKTKALDYSVRLPAKGWVLVLRVTNTQTGYAQFFTSSLNVVTPYTRGWYVAKDDGTGTDLDLFLTPESIMPAASKSENVFSAVNGHKIPGKAMLLNYYNDYKSDVLVAGKFVNTKSMFIIADKGMSVVDINSLHQIHDLNGIFYQAPAVQKPDFVTSASQALYFSNNGQLTSIYAMSANSGQFGTEKIMDDKATPYRLSKYHIGSSRVDGPVLFDEVSSSFITASGSGTTMTDYSNSSTTTMDARNTNKTCLYMGTRSAYPLEGIAVLRDKTDPKLMIVSTITTDDGFNAINDTVSEDSKMQAANRFAVNTDESMIYFVAGNAVWSHNLANDFEKLQWQAPAGEEITFLRHRTYSESGYSYNYVMIGTRQAGNYKVRMFTKSSGNLAATPAFALEGTGEVGDVMYIAPTTNTHTYYNSY